MAIIRGGNAEYESNDSDLAEKAAKFEEKIRARLAEDASVLKLNSQYIATDEMAVLARFTLARSLKSLDVSDNQIDDVALKTLFESPILENVEELSLGINFIADDGLLAVIRSPDVRMKNLKVLRLNDNRLTDVSVGELVKSPLFSGIKHLNIEYNKVGNATAKALAESETFMKLKILNIERGYIDDEGIRDFLKWRGLGSLVELNLSSNKLTDAGIKQLAAARNLGSLRILRLSCNLFGDEGALVLAKSPSLSGLTHLYVGRNNFGPAGAGALSESKVLANLKTLILKEGAETSPNLVNYSNPDMLAPRGH